MMRDLKGYEGLYKINESGVIINKNGHVMRTAQSNNGRLRVSLIDPIRLDPKRKNNESVSRLVAQTFLENPDPEKNNVVMHIDNDYLNNHVSNLKWGTQSENIQQAFDEGRKVSPATINPVVNLYEVYDEKSGDKITCMGRSAVAEMIQYKEVSLKNMVGNDREISMGPYAGYKIKKITNNRRITSPITFTKDFDFVYDVHDDD